MKPTNHPKSTRAIDMRMEYLIGWFYYYELLRDTTPVVCYCCCQKSNRFFIRFRFFFFQEKTNWIIKGNVDLERKHKIGWHKN